MKSVWTSLVSFTLFAAVATLTTPVDLGASGTAAPALSANGRVNATDVFGAEFPNAAQISLNASLTPGGDASGEFNLIASGDFGAAWGACPVDPRCQDYPNLTTAVLKLSGIVTGGTSLGDTVEVSGTLTEVDHGKGAGVIFREEDVPFVVTATKGSPSFVLQFCEVPPFTMEMAAGTLVVRPGTSPATLLARPAARPAALPCS